MKSIILYGTWAKLSANHIRVTVDGKPFYVRVERVSGTPDEILAFARPRKTECVLNSMPASFATWNRITDQDRKLSQYFDESDATP